MPALVQDRELVRREQGGDALGRVVLARYAPGAHGALRAAGGWSGAGVSVCANISGTWELVGARDMTPMEISQGECQFSGRFDTADDLVRHLVTGRMGSGAATITVERWDSGGCYTRLYGLVRLDGDRLLREITGSDGKCGVASGYRENREGRRERRHSTAS